MKCRSSVRSC